MCRSLPTASITAFTTRFRSCQLGFAALQRDTCQTSYHCAHSVQFLRLLEHDFTQRKVDLPKGERARHAIIIAMIGKIMIGTGVKI